ncbi:MAG: ArsR/SmtB family transcription factor [Candidatus Methylomirabilales bacterium]
MATKTRKRISPPLPADTPDVCDVPVIHVEKVRALKERLLPGQVVRDLAEVFKVMGDPSRARIVHALSQEELCVCDLAAVLGMSVSAVSHQLRILRNLRLVKFRRDGRMVYYSLDDQHVIDIFIKGLHHVVEHRPVSQRVRAGPAG